MSSEKSDAVVIRQVDWSETSRVVTFFTREFGRISAIAKGARRLKGPFEAAIDLLVHCRIVFIRKSSSSLDILTEVQLISRFKPAGRDLLGTYGGYYAAELLAGLTEEYDPHPVLFDETVHLLKGLSGGGPPRPHILRFELIVLREIGQLPALDVCTACDRPVTQSAGPYAYWVSQGGLLCRSCQHEKYLKEPLEAATIAVMQQMAFGEPPEQLTPPQTAQIRTFTSSAIAHALGRKPKMARYLDC